MGPFLLSTEYAKDDPEVADLCVRLSSALSMALGHGGLQGGRESRKGGECLLHLRREDQPRKSSNILTSFSLFNPPSTFPSPVLAVSPAAALAPHAVAVVLLHLVLVPNLLLPEV